MSDALTEFAMIGVPSKDRPGLNISTPAVCVWLDADMDEKRVLIDYLRKFGPLGRSACQLLAAKDPRLFVHRHPGYGGGLEEFTGDRHPEVLSALRDKYDVGY
jgi:hypothetical protein